MSNSGRPIPIRKARRVARVAFLLGIAACLAWFLLRFDVGRAPPGTPAVHEIQPGSIVVFDTAVLRDYPVARGDLLRLRGEPGSAFFGRVLALNGDRVNYDDAGRLRVVFPGGAERVYDSCARDGKFAPAPGMLKADEYLVLPDEPESAPTGAPYGKVRGASITGKWVRLGF